MAGAKQVARDAGAHVSQSDEGQMHDHQNSGALRGAHGGASSGEAGVGDGAHRRRDALLSAEQRSSHPAARFVLLMLIEREVSYDDFGTLSGISRQDRRVVFP